MTLFIQLVIGCQVSDKLYYSSCDEARTQTNTLTPQISQGIDPNDKQGQFKDCDVREKGNVAGAKPGWSPYQNFKNLVASRKGLPKQFHK